MDDGKTQYLWVAAWLMLIVIIGVVDITLDGLEILWTSHFFVELSLVLVSFGLAAALFTRWRQASSQLRQTRDRLSDSGAERDAWRQRAQKFVTGLGEAIDAQLHEWGLTNSEKEVALLILKGLSHREIAELSERSERTVRQYAVAVYRKSGLSGRAELSAFFLEDLLQPAIPDSSVERAEPVASGPS